MIKVKSRKYLLLVNLKPDIYADTPLNCKVYFDGGKHDVQEEFNFITNT